MNALWNFRLSKTSLIGALLTLFSLVVAVWKFPSLQHWFVVPLFVLAALLSGPTVRWVSGRDDLFDSRGQLATFGMYFFVAAPLLHVIADFWMPHTSPPADWRTYLGRWALVSIPSVLLFLRVSAASPSAGDPIPQYRINQGVFWPVLTVLLLLSLICQVAVYAYFGGLTAYMNAALDDSNFTGLGVVFLVSEAFPILAILGFAIWAKGRFRKTPWVLILLAILFFFILKLFFGGLRGSRSNTIWGLFWAVGIIHIYLRPIPRQLVVVGLFALFGFMVAYSYIKSFGADGLTAIVDGNLRASDQRYGGDPVLGVALVDFSRADVQSYVIGKQWDGDPGYEYALGRTYLYALTMPAPIVRALIPLSLDNKRKEGTIALYGPGEYWHGGIVSSRLYGLGGEAALNFGFLSVPFAYLLLALLVKKYGLTRRGLHPEDPRQLIMPFVANLFLLMVIADSDNIVFYVFKNGTVAIGLIAVSMRKVRLGQRL